MILLYCHFDITLNQSSFFLRGEVLTSVTPAMPTNEVNNPTGKLSPVGTLPVPLPGCVVVAVVVVVAFVVVVVLVVELLFEELGFVEEVGCVVVSESEFSDDVVEGS